MKAVASILLLTMLIFYMIIPGIEEYNKNKERGKLKAIMHAIAPALVYVGLAFAGFIMFEIIPRIGGAIVDKIFN